MNRAIFQQKLSAISITEETLPVFENLLRLPYNEYKAVIELLLEKQITPEDFLESDGMINSPAVDEMRYTLRKSNKTLSETDITASILAKNAGREFSPLNVGYRFDFKGDVVDSTNVNKAIPYNPNDNFVITDGSFDSIIPNSDQIFQAGSVSAAKKTIQLSLLQRKISQ